MRENLLNLVLCKDLFLHCDGAVQAAREALLAATATWPGPEYVFHHPLLDFLSAKVPSAAKLFQVRRRLLAAADSKVTTILYHEKINE